MSKEQLSNFKSFVKLQLPTSLTDEQQEKMFNFTVEYFRKTVNTSRRRFLHLVDTTVATLSQEFDKLVDERESTSVEEKGAFQSKIQSVLNESAMAVNVEALFNKYPSPAELLAAHRQLATHSKLKSLLRSIAQTLRFALWDPEENHEDVVSEEQDAELAGDLTLLASPDDDDDDHQAQEDMDMDMENAQEREYEQGQDRHAE